MKRQVWKSFPNDVSLSDSEKASCCETWGNNPPENLNCCSFADYANSHDSICNNCKEDATDENIIRNCCENGRYSGQAFLNKCCLLTDADGYYTYYKKGNKACCNKWYDVKTGKIFYNSDHSKSYFYDDVEKENICSCVFNPSANYIEDGSNVCCAQWYYEEEDHYYKKEGFDVIGFNDLDPAIKDSCCENHYKVYNEEFYAQYCGVCDNVSEASASKTCCEYWANKADIWDNMSGAVQAKCCSYMKYNHRKCCTMDIYNSFGNNLSDDWCEYCIIKNKADYSMASGAPKNACCDKFYSEGKDQYRVYNASKGYYNSCCGGSGNWYSNHNDVRDWCCHYNDSGTVTWDIDMVGNSTGVAARMKSSNAYQYRCGSFNGYIMTAVVTYNVDLYGNTPDYLRSYWGFTPGPPYIGYITQNATDDYRKENNLDDYSYAVFKFIATTNKTGFDPSSGVTNYGKSNITCQIYKASSLDNGGNVWPGSNVSGGMTGWTLYSNSCSGSFPYSFKK